MQLVIKIPEEFYKALRKNNVIISGQRSGKTLMSVIYNAVANGTQLPKGHGDLIDKSALISVTDIKADGSEFTYVPYSVIEDTLTILEADKEKETI